MFRCCKQRTQLQFPVGMCIICANSKCKESTDHEFMDFQQFKELANAVKQDLPKVTQFKKQVKNYYQTLVHEFVQLAEKSCLAVLEDVNTYYFQHLTINPSQVAMLGQVLENDGSSLPSKKVWGIATALRAYSGSKRQVQNLKLEVQIAAMSATVDQKIKSFDSRKFADEMKHRMLHFSPILEKEERRSASFLNNSKMSQSSEQTNNEDQILEWKNLRIRSIVRNVVLSCKKLNDSQFLFNLPKLQKFPNIIEFEARQNMITHLSCIGINNHLPQLVSLDLRANMIGDIGLGKLKTLLNLKQLMIDRNGVSDRGVRFLIEGFPALELLWADGNKLTQVGVLLLCGKEVLKICSVVENCIDARFNKEIKSKFSRKGLIYI